MVYEEDEYPAGKIPPPPKVKPEEEVPGQPSLQERGRAIGEALVRALHELQDKPGVE